MLFVKGKNFMKKILKTLALPIILFSLVSCGETSSSILTTNGLTAEATTSEVPSSSETPSSSISSSSTQTEEVSVVSSVNVSDYDAKAITEPFKFNSVFTALAGTTIDGSTKTIEIDGETIKATKRLKLSGVGELAAQKKAVKIEVPEDNSDLLIAAISANSSDSSRKWAIADASYNELFTSENGVSCSAIDYLTYHFDTKGTYYFYSPINGINLYYLKLSYTTVLGQEVGFEVNASNFKKDYLLGEELDVSSLLVNAVYESGSRKDLDPSSYTIETNYNKDAVGSYNVSIKYKNYEPYVIEVKVHDITSLKAYYSFIMKSASSKEIYRVPLVYKLNDQVDLSNIVVKAGDETYVSKIANYQVSSIDTSSEGRKVIEISLNVNNKVVKDEIVINVINKTKLVADNEVYKVYVNSSLEDGTLQDSKLFFSSIQNAHDFLKTSVDDASKKEIVLQDNKVYEEKLNIEIPNLTLTGGTNTVIQKDYYASSVDENDTLVSTYGSSSVSIRSSATNFKATNITFKNSAFNTMAEYNACLDGSKQACAIVVDASSKFKDCSFVGFQDTLYARLGNQVYENCSIQGMTDYIFGEDANAYFKNCTITSLNRNSSTNGGYIATTKPSSAPSIGFLFDSCDIKGEEGVTEGTVSLARPWGQASKISYVNCTLDKAISTVAYGSGKNGRWEVMSGNKPENAAFSEYNNSGEGSISTPVKGGTFLSEEQYQALIALAAAL